MYEEPVASNQNITIHKLSVTCPSVSKTVGDTVTMRCTATSGVTPFRMVFKKDGAWHGEVSSVPINSPVEHYDYPSSAGTFVYSVECYDNCTDPAPQMKTESCTVVVNPAVTTGSISFASTPSGADIYLDGTLQTSKTPATITGVSAGSHTYLLRLVGYNDASGTVTVTAGQTATVSATLISTPGSITFSSTPSGADIYLDNVLQSAKTPATISSVSAGSHSYIVRLTGYNDATGTVTVTAGQTSSVSATLTPIVTTGNITFSTTPSGANIYIDNVLQTPVTPATITSVSAGTHTYILRLSGYSDATGTVTVTVGQTANVTVTLIPITGSISFSSTPSGASIYLDGTLVALTPATITGVSTGSHSYILRLTGYNDATGTVTVVAGQTATVSVTLTPVVTTGSISFTSTPSGADIYLDGTLQTLKTPATITSVSAGNHSYTLRLTGYNDATGTVTVTSGQTATISVTLVSTPGSISFSSTPSGASIYLDGTLVALTPATITGVSAGSHTYILRLTGYNDATGTVTVTSGQTATISVTLTPVVTTGSISFASTPSGADIYLDGTLQTAKTPATITSVSTGSHSYILRLSGYSDATGTVTVTSGQTTTISVTLVSTPGSISFSSTPSGASIYLDGTLVALTPATITGVSAGSHSYIIRLTGYSDATGTVTVIAGQTATVSVTLTPVVTTGSISFASTPSGADIYLDGTLQTLKTPATITGVSTGSHSYILRLSGYSDATGTVTVTSGQTVTVSATLSPASYAAWIASMGGISAIKSNLAAVGNIIDGYLGMVNLGFTVTLANVGTTIDYYLGVG
jgi:hypothetical protein